MLKELGKISRVISLMQTVDETMPLQTLAYFLEVAKEPDGINHSTAYKRAGIESSSSGTRNMRALADRHWIKLKPGLGLLSYEEDYQDSRRKIIRLQPKGRKIVKEIIAIMADEQR